MERAKAERERLLFPQRCEDLLAASSQHQSGTNGTMNDVLVAIDQATTGTTALNRSSIDPRDGRDETDEDKDQSGEDQAHDAQE